MAQRSLPLRLKSLLPAIRRSYPQSLIASDLLGFVPAFFVAGLVRNEFVFVDIRWMKLVTVGLVAAGAHLVLGWFSHLYRNRYQLASFDEVWLLGGCWAVAAGLAVFANVGFLTPRVPTSVVIMGMALSGGWMVLSRTIWRIIRRAEARPDPEGRTRVLVFGAGDGGTQVVRSMLADRDSRYIPVGILDDDLRKQNRSIEGVRVLGTSDDIGKVKRAADLLLIAVPSADVALINRLADQAAAVGLDVMILPSTTELFGMIVSMDTARSLEITDLLGREEVNIDNDSVTAYLHDRVVLVTGAGGSIGSELCRQILRYGPSRLVMLDRDETALQNLQLSVAGHGLLDDENLVLADIRDRNRMFEVCEHYRPEIVFHAAALKHLPLLESHPREGLLTNVFGTKNVLDAACSVDTKRFVNVSTDKAADPTSVLGTTKRLAETLTVQAGQQVDGEFISVRFGNVIGSRGSVLPAFEAQIAAGGPVTVTHPDVTRYFMSIPEASRLVLQAGAIGVTGETLVLDMGEPMKIVDLANRLLQHHKSDAEIVFTGLRENEKLHEVLRHDGEVMTIGEHPRIWHTDALIARGVDYGSLLDVPVHGLAEHLLAIVATSSAEAEPRGTVTANLSHPGRSASR